MPETQVQRRVRFRQKRAADEERILQAAETYLDAHPYRELTVDKVMAEAGMPRAQFYRSFQDREDLFVRLFERASEQLNAVTAPWHEGQGSLAEQVRTSLEGVAEVFTAHGGVMRGIAEAAAFEPDLAAQYQEFLGELVELSTRRIEAEVAAGRSRVEHPRGTATALVLMTEAYFRYTSAQQVSFDAAEAVETTMHIWMSGMFGDRHVGAAQPRRSQPVDAA